MSENTVPGKRANDARERRQLLVRGVVQGVGFRPFIYRLAHEEGLGGFIGNDTDGVTIEVEGKRRVSMHLWLACPERFHRWHALTRW